MKKTVLVQLIEGIIDEKLQESQYDPMFNRMDGLVNIEDLNNFKTVVRNIQIDLMEEAFEREEVNIFLKHIIEQIR